MGLSELIFAYIFLSFVVICAIIFIVVRVINKRRSYSQKLSEDHTYTPSNTLPRESVQNNSEKDSQKVIQTQKKRLAQVQKLELASRASRG